MPKPKDAMRGFLAVALIAAFQLAFFWLLQYEVPTKNERLVTFMLGQLSIFAGIAVNFYLASSKSSADKTELLREARFPADVMPQAECDCGHEISARSYPDPEFGFEENSQ